MINKVKNKIYLFNFIYEKMSNFRKKILMISVFLILSLMLTETLFFKSLDKYKLVTEEINHINEKNNSILKEKEEIYLKNAYKTEKSLLKQKKDLSLQIDNLLKTNKIKNFINSEEIPLLIEKVVNNISSLNLIDFKNIVSINTNVEKENILIRHSFYLSVNGNFSSIYSLLKNIEKIEGVNLTEFKLEKNKDNLVANFNFYVLNTNKNIINF